MRFIGVVGRGEPAWALAQAMAPEPAAMVGRGGEKIRGRKLVGGRYGSRQWGGGARAGAVASENSKSTSFKSSRGDFIPVLASRHQVPDGLHRATRHRVGPRDRAEAEVELAWAGVRPSKAGMFSVTPPVLTSSNQISVISRLASSNPLTRITKSWGGHIRRSQCYQQWQRR